MNIHQTTLIVLAASAAICDLRSGKVPNGIIVSGALCGAAGCCMRQGGAGLLLSVTGAAVPLLLLIILFYLRMIGAGDIKLLSMAGAFTGPARSFHILIFTFLIGAAASAALLIKRGIVHSRFQYLKEYVSDFFLTGTVKPYLDGVGEDGRFCFSVCVLFAVLAEQFLRAVNL